MKTIFMGTPEIAVRFLKRLTRISSVELVITQPDRPSGRGLKLTPCPVKRAAEELGIAVLSPLKPADIIADIKKSGADMAVVVAYGRMLKPDVLSSCGHGCLNIHFSYLPKYRGAAPVQWSLINGETSTGVSSFWIDNGMDTGPMQEVVSACINPEDDAVSLMERLGDTGVELMERSVLAVEKGDIRRIGQQGEPSLAPLINKDLSLLDFNRPAVALHNLCRGLAMGPFPRAFIEKGGHKIMVQFLKTASADCAAGAGLAPGSVVRVERGGGFVVKCNEGGLLVEQVRPEGRNRMSGWDFANGFQLKAGDIFCS